METMKPRIIGAMMAVALVAVPVLAQAETMTFKMLSNYSRATFKSDAPLETFVGNTAAEGITGTLTVDPAKPAEARGTDKVDMNQVRTGIDKRDADMRSKDYIDTANEANRWVTFEIKSVEITGPLEPGATVPAKVHGILTVRQKAVERVADATVTYIKLTPEQVEDQKRFGFTSDNIKVRAKMATTFTDHGCRCRSSDSQGCQRDPDRDRPDLRHNDRGRGERLTAKPPRRRWRVRLRKGAALGQRRVAYSLCVSKSWDIDADSLGFDCQK
jgi:polyisoprenoid-binding protein YceI